MDFLHVDHNIGIAIFSDLLDMFIAFTLENVITNRVKKDSTTDFSRDPCQSEHSMFLQKLLVDSY